MNATSVGTAELLLNTDRTVGDEHTVQILKLAGRGITRSQICIVGSGRSCTWPLELDATSVTSRRDVGSHIWQLSDYLGQNRDTVNAIHDLGCNLQLNVYGVQLDPRLPFSSSTLKQLGDLHIQLELFP